MAIPVVAIVGRPNVGKSALLNCLAKRKISIVDPMAGVTRDRVGIILDVNETYFELVDTGGYGVEDADGLTERIEGQIQFAVNRASLILFVVDAREGVTPLDQKVAARLRKQETPVLLVANKIDRGADEGLVGELYALGFGDPMQVSALHGRGRQDLLDALVAGLAPLAGEKPATPTLKLAIVGRRNVGKSTFINCLAGEDRLIVSEVPGTTRDSVDVRFEKDGRVYVAIDTAGLRKKRKIADDVEYFGYSRAFRSIRRADVVLFFIDATVPIGEVDKRLGTYIVEQFKPCVLVVNKWDLAKGRASTEEYGAYFAKILPGLDFAPIAFTTAMQAKNVQSTLDLATTLHKQAGVRVSTAELNAHLEEILALRGPSPKRGAKRPKIFYGTQIGVRPPTLVLFVNDPAAITPEYQRFLLNRFRERLPYDEVPIRLLFRARRGRDQDGEKARDVKVSKPRHVSGHGGRSRTARARHGH
jgi:GTP-binding protein